jgi:hypothetical protein
MLAAMNHARNRSQKRKDRNADSPQSNIPPGMPSNPRSNIAPLLVIWGAPRTFITCALCGPIVRTSVMVGFTFCSPPPPKCWTIGDGEPTRGTDGPVPVNRNPVYVAESVVAGLFRSDVEGPPSSSDESMITPGGRSVYPSLLPLATKTPPPGRDSSCLYISSGAGGWAVTPAVGFRAGGVTAGGGASVASYRRNMISAV